MIIDVFRSRQKRLKIIIIMATKYMIICVSGLISPLEINSMFLDGWCNRRKRKKNKIEKKEVSASIVNFKCSVENKKQLR